MSTRAFDTLLGRGGDLLRRCVEARLRRDIRAGKVLALMMGPPCSSFSIYNNALPGGPIRSKQFPRGLPGLVGKPLDRVILGNSYLRFVIRTIRLCRRFKVPFGLEHPQSSYMWSDGELL